MYFAGHSFNLNEPMIENKIVRFLFIFLSFTFNVPFCVAQSDGVFHGGVGPIPVRTMQDEAGMWHLTRDGKPYEVRGAGGNVQLDKLVEIGGNSIRTWSTDNAQEILDEAHSKGLTVMLGLWVQHERHGFDYNDEKKETFGTDRQLGFYAQNVNAAIGPEAAPDPESKTAEDGTVTTKPWGYFDRSVLAVAVDAIKVQQAQIIALTARIAALEAK